MNFSGLFIERCVVIMPKNESEYPDLVLIFTTTSNYDAGQIKEVLENNSIPALFKPREFSDFVSIIFGNSSFGVDIFVPEELENKARDLIAPIVGLYGADSEDAEEFNDGEILGDFYYELEDDDDLNEDE